MTTTTPSDAEVEAAARVMDPVAFHPVEYLTTYTTFDFDQAMRGRHDRRLIALRNARAALTAAYAIRAQTEEQIRQDEREQCLHVVDTEEELDGDPPFNMSQESQSVARAIVRATKKSIAARIRARSTLQPGASTEVPGSLEETKDYLADANSELRQIIEKKRLLSDQGHAGVDAREVLRELEWNGCANCEVACPSCFGTRKEGHAPGCRLAVAIEGTGPDQVKDLEAEVERLKREADGDFVSAAVKVMQAYPGYEASDYAADGISADDFGDLLSGDMAEAWNQTEAAQERMRTAESALAAERARVGIPDEMRKLSEAAHPGPFRTGPYKSDIWAPSSKGGDTKLFDVRGSGYYSGKGHGALGMSHEEAARCMDANADFAVAAMNYVRARAALDAAKTEEGA